MRLILRRKLAIGAAVLAAAAFAGGAYAAAQQSRADSRQAFLNDVAKRLNVSPERLKSALKGAFEDQLQAAVAAGKITQAQANAIKQHVQRKGVPPLGLLHPGLFESPRHLLLPGPHGKLAAAAKYLGLSEQQLFRQLGSGKSLAQIASARGKSVSGLKDAMAAEIRARLDKAVAGKLLTSAQEQKILSSLSSILDTQINRKGVGFGPRWGFHRGFGAGAGRALPRWIGPPPKTVY
jgi:AraC-like DNA-binding protein